jgi:cation transport protein ChaC
MTGRHVTNKHVDTKTWQKTASDEYFFLVFQATTWGMAFELVGEMALKYLEQLECTLRGYRTLITMFYPRNGTMTPFPALLYIATPGNSQWLGPAPLHEMASQVSTLVSHYVHVSRDVICPQTSTL